MTKLTKGVKPKLSPEEFAAKQAREAEERRAEIEEHNAHMRERFPTGRKFYSYSLPNDTDWRVLTELPTEEFINAQNGAMKWGARMIYIGLQGKVITAMHYDSRVVEFEYVHVTDKEGRISLYDPLV